MADIKYLNYGNQQVDEQALLTSMANDVQNYVNSQPWSNKRKQKFMTAYSDIMNRGIQGASNETGQWRINVGGTPYQFDQMDRKDREMYGEAAYFIQQQMNRLATTPKTEEEKTEEIKLIPYGNNFGTVFGDYIGRTYFGNRNFNIGGEKDDWNYLDERDAQGIRGRQNRSERLAQYLESYRDSLKENTYDFTDSPFSSLDDLKNKLNSAINALRTGENTQDDTDTLNALGLDARDWFNNGSGDVYVDENGYSYTNPNTQKPFTFAEWNNYQNQLNTQKQKQETAAAEAKQKALDSLQVINPQEVKTNYTLEQLANKYGGDLSKAVAQYNGKNISSLTQEENDELVSLFKGGYNSDALDNISDEDWETIQTKLNNPYIDRNQYRKIEGLNGVYYDIGKQTIFQIGNFAQQGNKNFLQGLSDTEKQNEIKAAQQEYLQNTEWTNDQWRELGGIAADVLSVVDPEPVTAGISALTGTGLRTWNRIFDKDGFTWSDAGHTALDAGLSLLGMIPVVGDAALTARVIGKLQKAAGWLGGIFAAASVPQAAKAAWDKVVNGKDLTVDDWRAIGNVFMGITQVRRIQLNRAAGNVVKNSEGGVKTEKVGEVEVKVGDKVEKVQIGEQAAKELKADYQKAGSDLEKTNQALRRSREVREQLEAKKGSDGKQLYTKEQLDAIEAPRAAAGSIKGKNSIESLRPTRGITSTTRTVTTEGTPITETSPRRVRYMANNQGFFKRGNYGWNINGKTGNEGRSWLRRQWDNLVRPYLTPKVEAPKVETPKAEVKQTEAPTAQVTTAQSKFIPEGVSTGDLQQINKALGNARNYNMTGSTRVPKAEVPTQKFVDGSDFTVSFKDNTITVSQGEKVLKTIKEKSLQEAKLQFGKWLNEYNSKLTLPAGLTKDSAEWKAFVKSIKDLKRNGYLMKQGGKITNEQIDKFLQQ